MKSYYRIADKLRHTIRNIPDFPNPGIDFKDITPVLQNPTLCKEVLEAFLGHIDPKQVDVVVGVESRGFFFGILLASALQVPFVPIRKKGKLPYETLEETYTLEYGSASIEMHKDAFPSGANVLLHDDLLATGGTIAAAGRLIEKMGGRVTAFTFLVELSFLNGRSKLKVREDQIISLTAY